MRNLTQPLTAGTARSTPGHVAINEARERELDEHPDDVERWLVYADWLQAEGDLRGELIARQHRGVDFKIFVDEHLDQLFPACADEIRGGGQSPELVLEWKHGFVIGATLSALDPERAVDLGELVARLLPLPICRFIRRLSFGPNHGATQYGAQANDYAPLVKALIAQPRLARIHQLEFGLQEPEIDEDSDVPEQLLPWGDLSELWPHVPQLRELRVKGSGGILGEVVLPELRAVTLEFENLAPEIFRDVLAANWPRLERFELWDQADWDQVVVEVQPLLQVLSTLPLTHLALPFTDQLDPLLRGLMASPLLKRLRVLDLHNARLHDEKWLIEKIDAFRHLDRFDLSGTSRFFSWRFRLQRLGDFIVFEPLQEPPPEPPEIRVYLVGETWRGERISARSAEEAALVWCGRDLHRSGPRRVPVVVAATGEKLEIRVP